MPVVDLRALPKVDLHRHLEGAVRLATIIDLYRDAGTPLPETTPEELAPRAQVLRPMASLAEVLQYFGVAQQAFRTLDAVERIAFEAVEDLAADNVRLAELRFSPDFLSRSAGLDWDEAFGAIRTGAARAAGAGGVEVGFIAIVSRSYGMESARQTMEFALRNRGGLVGFHLADDELQWPAAMFADLMPPLREAGLHLTAHYGEAGPPSYPREAIEVLGVERLGHGVSVAGDPAVVALARDRGVTLEMAPTSNERTMAVPSLAEHPARRLLHEGVRVTVNTDDPGLFGIDLTHELEVARDVLGFDDADLAAVTRNALESSFLPPEVRDRVRAAHFSWVDQARPDS